MVFSGNASQVEAAFNTQIRQYVVSGVTHYANATPVQIPAAFSGVVAGPVKLNDFHSRPPQAASKVVPQYTSASGAHYLVPADYGVIYDLNSVYTNGYTGTAQSIAVVGRSDVLATDISAFRSNYGLAANPITTIIANGTDPGVTNDSNTLEGTLDVEWAGAIAPNASIQYVVAASTATTDGVDLAAQYVVNNKVAPILSVSYGTCEAQANNSFYSTLWEQAAVEGISVIVAAGDSGAAGCDPASASTGTVQAVNAICSTPYNTCVGGTMFEDTQNPGGYWQPGNNALMGSAISYIPEQVWNESALDGGSGLSATGGGVSTLYLKPYYQTVTGVPNDGHRDVPDVSLSASQHDGYMIYYDGNPVAVAGTSAATPSFAGIMALVNQKAGGSQGNINQVLYPLFTSSASVFHDITSGNNSVPGVTGYAANVGYDLVSGLGSVDGAQLVNNWTKVINGFVLTESVTTVNATPALPGINTISLVDVGTFNLPVTLTLSGLPKGVAGTFAPGTLNSSGSSILTIGVYGTALSGTYPITVTATAASFVRTLSFNLVVTVTTGCTLIGAPTSLTVLQSQTTSLKLTCANPTGNFATSLALALTGAPTGLTTSFSPAATLAAGTGVTSLLVTAGSTVTPGTYTLVITATLPNASPSYSTTLNIPLTVTAPTTFTVTPSVTSISVAQGNTATLTLTSAQSGAFNNPISFSTSGLPSTVSAALSATSVPTPGNGTITVTLTAMTVATTGTYTMTVLAQGGGLALRVPIIVKVTTAPAFAMTTSASVMTLRQTYVSPTNVTLTGTASVIFTIGSLTNGFNSAVAFSVGTLPTGVTAAFSSATLAAPGSGTSTLTLTASATATTGVTTFTVTATGGSITRYINIELILTPPSTFSLSSTYPGYTLMTGSSMSQTLTSTPLYGFNSNITLTATTPAGINANFSPVTINGAYGTSTVTIQVSPVVVAGTYAITLTGTAPNGNVETAQVSLTVASVVTTLSATTLSIAPGTSTTNTVTTVATSYTGNVVLTVTGLPPGVSYALSPTTIVGGSGSSTLTVLASTNAQKGSYLVTVTSSAAGVAFTTLFTLTIT